MDTDTARFRGLRNARNVNLEHYCEILHNIRLISASSIIEVGKVFALLSALHCTCLDLDLESKSSRFFLLLFLVVVARNSSCRFFRPSVNSIGHYS